MKPSDPITPTQGAYVAKKRTTDVEAPGIATATEAPPVQNGNGNGHAPQTPRKIVQVYECQSSKDVTIRVEVLENTYDGQNGTKVTVLNTVLSRLYVKPDGEVGTSYTY